MDPTSCLFQGHAARDPLHLHGGDRGVDEEVPQHVPG